TPACFTPGGGINGSGGATRYPGLPRNFFKQPSIQFLDLRVSRRFPIGEKAKIEVLAEAFNFFNRTQVTGVNTTLYNLSGTTLTFNPSFGQTTGADSTLFRERQVQSPSASSSKRPLNFSNSGRVLRDAPFLFLPRAPITSCQAHRLYLGRSWRRTNSFRRIRRAPLPLNVQQGSESTLWRSAFKTWASSARNL